MKLLWVNACAHEKSRTYELTRIFIDEYCKKNDVVLEELRLFDEKNLNYFDWKRVNERLELQKQKKWEHPMFSYARQWIGADRIIISAPYWDLSFPAILKIYFESVFVTGLSFKYTEEGIPQGLSKADKLLYVMTSGGPVSEHDRGYEYISDCAKMLGIKTTERLSAEGLDVIGWNHNEIMRKAKDEAAKLAKNW